MRPLAFLFAIVLGVTGGTALAQDITVTISSDTIDIDWQSATIADLPGPDGEVSFSEAMIAANNTPGHQVIGFAIPADDWILQFLYPGRAVLTALTGYFWNASEAVTIDGTTQTAYTGDTNPDGWEVVIYGDELYLNGDNCTLIGFDSSAVTVSGSGGVLQGNTGTMNITVGGGAGSLIKDNTGGTIKIDRSNDNVVVGNTVQRVRVLGAFGLGQEAVGNRVGGPDLEDRNFITGYGTWNGEGLPGGITVQIVDTVGTVVQNNWIGTTPDGLEQGSLASVVGIGFSGRNHDAVIRDNRIAGILGHGQNPHHAGELYGWAILLGGDGSDVTITGNTIGLDANDDPVLGSVWGIDAGNVITSPCTIDGITIGGAGPGEGNVVAGHLLNGVTVGREVPPVRISGTAMYDNGWLGIDLIPTGYGYGVSANDAFDADTGGNGLQNFPIIDSATREGGAVRFMGTLHSSPADTFTLEFFVSPECDESGFGEGQVYLGAAGVTTDVAGDAAFDVLLPGSVADGWLATATATLEPVGSTSEFSACVTVTGDWIPGDLDGDGVIGAMDLALLLGSWGPCSNCAADLTADQHVDAEDLAMLLGNWG